MKKLLALCLSVAMLLTMTSFSLADAAQELIICVGSQPETIDPQLNSSADGSVYIRHMYEGLMKLGWEGEGVVYAVAESHEVSEDGLVWTFKLREDAKWRDGQPVVADDFVYAWRRLVNPETASPYASDMGKFVKNGKLIIEGEVAPEEYGVVAIDDHTLEVTLEAPCTYFLEIASFPSLYPVRQDLIEANGDGWFIDPETNIGNGAYQMESWSADEEIVLVPNPEYCDADKVVAQKLVFKLINDSNAILTALRSGELMYGTNFPQEEMPAMMEEGLYQSLTQLGTYYVDFQTKAEPFDNPLVRKAFTLAVDPIYIAENVMLNSVKPATNFVGPGFMDTDGTSEFGAFEAVIDRSDYEANKELAREALAEAGYPNGEGFPTIEYTTNPTTAHIAIGEALAFMWKDVLGVDATVAQQEWNVFQELRRKGDFQVCRDGWTADVADPSNLLDLFTSASGNNHTMYADPDFDALMEIAHTSADQAERMEAMHKAEALAFGEDYVAIPLYYYALQFGMNPALKNVAHYPTGERLFFLSTFEP